MKELKEIRKDVFDVDSWLDEQYGAEGTEQREAFRREAYAFSMGQMILQTRKSEKMTQATLAKLVGTNKSYISKIENGLVEPGIGMFFRILDTLGLKFEISKPIMSV